MNISGIVDVTGSQTQDFGTTQFHELGAVGRTRDGRYFRYAKCGGATLVVGDFLQSPAVVVNHLTLTPAAAAIGASQVTVALGATEALANQYAEGYLMTAVTPGMGRTYQISGHRAAALSTSVVLTLAEDEKIQIALSTSSRVHLLQNPYRGVIQMPVTTATGICVGVAVSPMTDGTFGWIQTKGLCCPLTDGTPALGAHIMVPGAVAGAGEIVVAAGTLVVAQFVGRMAMVGIDNVRNAVMLDIV